MKMYQVRTYFLLQHNFSWSLNNVLTRFDCKNFFLLKCQLISLRREWLEYYISISQVIVLPDGMFPLCRCPLYHMARNRVTPFYTRLMAAEPKSSSQSAVCLSWEEPTIFPSVCNTCTTIFSTKSWQNSARKTLTYVSLSSWLPPTWLKMTLSPSWQNQFGDRKERYVS